MHRRGFLLPRYCYRKMGILCMLPFPIGTDDLHKIPFHIPADHNQKPPRGGFSFSSYTMLFNPTFFLSRSTSLSSRLSHEVVVVCSTSVLRSEASVWSCSERIFLPNFLSSVNCSSCSSNLLSIPSNLLSTASNLVSIPSNFLSCSSAFLASKSSCSRLLSRSAAAFNASNCPFLLSAIPSLYLNPTRAQTTPTSRLI